MPTGECNRMQMTRIAIYWERGRRLAATIFLAVFVQVTAPAPALADAILSDTDNGPHPVLDFPPVLDIAGAQLQRTASHDSEGRPSETLTVRRGQHVLLRLRAYQFELHYQAKASGAGPDAIVTGWTGGAHCCFTIHAVWLSHDFRQQIIPVMDNDETGFLPDGRGPDAPPKLRFGDFTFAYWRASFADSPAPTVIFRFDSPTGRYAPDIAAMRKPAPDDTAVAAMAKEVRGAERDLPKGDSPAAPLLWKDMLDLIYSGNAPAAHRLFEMAWPEDRDGKDEFLACFTEKPSKGIWRRSEKLGRLLEAESVFRVSAATPKDRGDDE